MRSGADQNGDNLRINRAYLRISDRYSVTVRVRVRIKVRVRVRLGLGLRIVVYKLLEKVTKCGSVKSHVIKTDQWRSDP